MSELAAPWWSHQKFAWQLSLPEVRCAGLKGADIAYCQHGTAYLAPTTTPANSRSLGMIGEVGEGEVLCTRRSGGISREMTRVV